MAEKSAILPSVRLNWITARLTYANVVATIALFVALGGTTIAATKLHGSQIQRGTITGKQIRKGSVPGADLRRNSVTGQQVNEAKLGTVPRATKADSATSATTANRAGSAAKADLATKADLASDAERLEGKSADDFLVHCEEGMRAYAGVCFEAQARTTNTWPAAAKICGDAGGRLPRLDELEGFRQLPGVTLSGTEHTASYMDINGPAEGGEYTVGINDAGTRGPGFVYGTSYASFRCVKPKNNL